MKAATSNQNRIRTDALDSGNPAVLASGSPGVDQATDHAGLAKLSGLAEQVNFGSGGVYGLVALGPRRWHSRGLKIQPCLMSPAGSSISGNDETAAGERSAE